MKQATRNWILEQSARNKLFSGVGIDPDKLSKDDKQFLAGCLDRDLSPEVMHMDGERRGRELAAYKKLMTTVEEDLKTLDIRATVY